MKKGFAYIELIFSISILGIIVGAGFPALDGYIQHQRGMETVRNAERLNSAVSDIFRLNGVTNETFIHCGFDRWDELDAMLIGGLSSFHVEGFEFTPENLDNCKMFIDHFRGIAREDLYLKF